MSSDVRNKSILNENKNYFLVDHKNTEDVDPNSAIFWAFEDNATNNNKLQLLNQTQLKNYVTKYNQIDGLKAFLENKENIRFFKEKKLVIIISFHFAMKLSGLLRSNFFIEKIFILFEKSNEIDNLANEFQLENFSDMISRSAHTVKSSNIFPENDFNSILQKTLKFLESSRKQNKGESNSSLVSIGSSDKGSKNFKNEDYDEIDILSYNLYSELTKNLGDVCQEYLEVNFLINIMENKENIENAKNDFISYCENKIKKNSSLLRLEDFNAFKAKISERRSDNYSIIKFIAKNHKFYNFFNKILINENFDDIFKIRYLLFMTKADLNNLKTRKTLNPVKNELINSNNKLNGNNGERDNQKFCLYKKSVLTREDLKTINSCKNYPLLIKGFVNSVDNLQYLIHNISSKNAKKVNIYSDTSSVMMNNNEDNMPTSMSNESINVIFFIELEGRIFNDKKFIMEYEVDPNDNNSNKNINNTSYVGDNEPINFDMRNYLILNNVFLSFTKVKIAKSYHEVYCNLKTFNDIKTEFNSLVLSLEEKLNRISNKTYEDDLFYVVEYTIILQQYMKFDELLKQIKINNEDEIWKTIKNLCSSSSGGNSSAKKSIVQDPNTALFRSFGFKNLIAKNYFLGLFKNLSDNQNDAIEFYEKALNVAEPIETKKVKLTTADKDIYSYYSEILGNVYYDLAKIKLNIYIENKNTDHLNSAFENIEKSLDKRKKIFAEKSKEIAECFNIKGIIYKNSNQFDDAMDLYQMCMNIKKELFTENSLELTNVLNNIGNVLSKKGKLDEALSYYNQSLNICLDFYKEDNAETADCYSNIGNTYYSKGENKLSIENHNKALQMYLNTLGKENTLTAITHINLGLAYYAMGDWDNAVKNYQSSLEIEKIIHGEVHSDTANCYNNLGNAYNNQKEYEKAIESLQKCLEIRIKTVGEENTETANSYNNLGNVYLSMEDFENALKFYTLSFNIKLNKNGDKSPDTACAMNNIGLVHLRKDEFDKALEFFKKSFNIKINTLGKNHPSTNRTKMNIDLVEKILEEIKKEEEE